MPRTDDRPNILLLMTDQHRGDCLGMEGHPVLQTPYLDHIGASGSHFRRAYTACPVCIPARRTLMTGRRPASHGVLMNYHTWLDGPTLPGELSKAGYQAHLVGKLHLWPLRKLYGFASAAWSDSPRPGVDCDYQRFLRREGVYGPRISSAHGMDANGWAVRPWHLDERHHFTTWCASMAIDFLERRDPTLPFFLKVSFIHPHQPLTPPRDYYERYMAMDLPEPYVGDWARVFDGPQRGLPVASWRTALEPAVMKQYRAAYYASINHVDDQIGRVLEALPRKTIVLFLADHGEMLGDHQWIRKRSPYEPSARIPMVMRLPQEMGIPQRHEVHQVVELMDVMPTLLEAAGAKVPETVEGRSLLPLLRDENPPWREYLHGECAEMPTAPAVPHGLYGQAGTGQQYLTDGRRKYVWFPGQGAEQYFDLESDPREMHDLAADPARAGEVRLWRERLVEELEGRPEGFTDGKRLLKLDGPTPFCLPGFEPSDSPAKGATR